MSNYSQYIKNIGHADFQLQPLNEVDIAILVELVYLKMDQYISHMIHEANGISIGDFYQRFVQNQTDIHEENPFMVSQVRLDLVQQVALAPRYRQIEVFGFQSEIDLNLEMQFAAATFHIPDLDQYIVVFRGTDDTIVGWKEDFNMSYQEEIPAQAAAYTYLEQILKQTQGHYLVAGHSKGANLAIYAATQLAQPQQEQLEAIYAFDGPGFQRAFLETSGYRAIEQRIKPYQPQDAVVSQILFHSVPAAVIEARGVSMMQHMTESWEIDQCQFKRAEGLTAGSQRLQATLAEWVDQHSAQELQEFFASIFNLIESTGVTSINDINQNLLQFLMALQKEVRQTEDMDQLKSGFSSLQTIYRNQGQAEEGESYLSQLQARFDGAIAYFKQLLPTNTDPSNEE